VEYKPYLFDLFFYSLPIAYSKERKSNNVEYFKEELLEIYKLKIGAMYFAVNQDIQNIETYSSFLNEILNSGNTYYANLFREIIEETQKLITSNDYYSVSSKRFAIVKHLSQFPEIITTIDINNLKKEDFDRLIACFDKHLSAAN